MDVVVSLDSKEGPKSSDWTPTENSRGYVCGLGICSCWNLVKSDVNSK